MVIHMIGGYIFAFALVLLAATSVALASLIFVTRAEAKRLRGFAVQLRASSVEHSKRLASVETKTPTVLAAKVDELSEAVAKLADTHRKFAGRMDRRYQLDRGTAEADPYADVDDPKWRALRAAQEATPGDPTR
jgi:hypothetical protein